MLRPDEAHPKVLGEAELVVPSHSYLHQWHRQGDWVHLHLLGVEYTRWVAVVYRLQECMQVNLMKFKNAKFLVLHLGWDNPYCQCRPGDEWIESNPVWKHLVMLVDKKQDGL